MVPSVTGISTREQVNKKKSVNCSEEVVAVQAVGPPPLFHGFSVLQKIRPFILSDRFKRWRRGRGRGCKKTEDVCIHIPTPHNVIIMHCKYALIKLPNNSKDLSRKWLNSCIPQLTFVTLIHLNFQPSCLLSAGAQRQKSLKSSDRFKKCKALEGPGLGFLEHVQFRFSSCSPSFQAFTGCLVYSESMAFTAFFLAGKFQSDWWSTKFFP